MIGLRLGLIIWVNGMTHIGRYEERVGEDLMVACGPEGSEVIVLRG